MQPVDLKISYSLSREAASRLLRVSIRTLDRYVKARKLSTRLVDDRIWLNKMEVEGFGRSKAGAVGVDDVYMSRPGLSTDKIVDGGDDMSTDHVYSYDEKAETFSKKAKNTGDSETFKNLYLELKEEVSQKQERLEIANYRVGQLEAQLKNTVPLLEYHREKYEKSRVEEEIKGQLNESNNLIKRLSLSLKYERFNKRIFLIILLVILALQPLLLSRVF
ncbi:MAG: hypothetical protein AAB373_06525 [Patescibacteria group bacterium]